MTRDRRLHGLTSDHHHALVLAQKLIRRTSRWGRDDGLALAARFEAELEPHFRVEEQVLLPALREAGATALCERTEADHARLREALGNAIHGDAAAARGFGERLRDHVRFEERELFPACEQLLAPEELAEVARRAPTRR